MAHAPPSTFLPPSPASLRNLRYGACRFSEVAGVQHRAHQLVDAASREPLRALPQQPILFKPPRPSEQSEAWPRTTVRRSVDQSEVSLSLPDERVPSGLWVGKTT